MSSHLEDNEVLNHFSQVVLKYSCLKLQKLDEKMLNAGNLENMEKNKSVSLALFKGNQILVYILLICILCHAYFPQNDIMLLSSPNDVGYYYFHVNKILFTFF